MTGRAPARLAAAVAMVALSAVLVRGAPAQAQTAPAPARSTQVSLTDQTTWVGDGGTFRLGLDVVTPQPAGARVQLSIYQAVTSRSDFTESLSDRIHTSRIRIFDAVALSSLGASPELSVAVNPKASAHATQSVHLPVSGVYPVRVDLYDSAGDLLGRVTTHLVYTGADASNYARLDVAWVVPFHAAPAVAHSDAALTGLSNQLAHHPSVPLTVAATPETVDGLANGADRAAVSQLAQALGNRELLAAPYVRLDLPAMIGAGLDGEIGAQLATGSDVLAADLHAVPTSVTWFEPGPLTPAAIDELAGRGVQRIIVADKSLTALPAEDRVRTLAQPFTVAGKGGRVAGASVDAGLAAHFVAPGGPVLAAHQLLADLAMIQLELPNRRGGRGVVLAPPPGWPADASFLATVLDGLASAPMLAPVTVERLFADVTPLLAGQNPLSRGVAPADQQPQGQAISDGAAIRAARRPVDSLAAVVPPATPAIAEIQRHLLVSESADIADRARPAEVAVATKLIDHLKGMVRLPGDQSITFTARQGLIPISILSSAPFPMRVRVRVTSQKLGFRAVGLPGGACTQAATSEICTVDLKAQNTTVRVPVVAKTAGVFSLTVAIDTPDGALNLATNQDTVRSTAASGVGVILSLGAALLLFVWWVRDVVHGRRARRLMPKRFDSLGFGEPALVGTGEGESGRRDGGGDAGRDRAGGGTGGWDGAGGGDAGRDRAGGGAGGRDGAGAGAGVPDPVLRAGVQAEPRRSEVPAGAPAVGPGSGVASQVAPSGAVPVAAGAAAPVVRATVAGTARAGAAAPARPASWDDKSGLTTQPIPIVTVDLPTETPQPSAWPLPRGAGPGAPRPPSPAGRPLPVRPAPGRAPRGDSAFSRNTSVMAVGTLLSRLTGFGRVLALIWAFGIASGLTDIYTIANTAPNILYDLVLGGILSATLVPVFVDYLNRDDPDEGWRAVSAVVTAITVTLLALSAVFWLATPAIIRFYLVLNNTAGAADQRAIGTTLLHMFVPQLFLLGGIAVTTALLNAHRRFAAVAFSPVVNNLVAIGAIVAARLVATSLTLPGFRADQSALIILGLGTTAGYLFQFLVQVPPMVRAGFRLHPVWAPRHPAVRTVLRLSLWTFGSVMANQVSFNLILVLADHRRGDVAVFTTAYQFFQLPYAIFAVSIASVITPDLSEHWAKRDLDGFRRQMANGLKLTMAVLVPAAVGYVVLAQPFLHLVLRHGSFSAGDAHRIGSVVALFAVGLPGFSAYLLLMRAYQAMQDTRSMFWLYLVENAATLVLAGALYPILGVEGLALGWVGAYTVGSLAAFAHLRRRTGGLAGQAIAASLVRVVGATVIMALPVLALTNLVNGHGAPALAAQVGGGVLAGSLVYFAAAHVFGISEITNVVRRWRHQ